MVTAEENRRISRDNCDSIFGLAEAAASDFDRLLRPTSTELFEVTLTLSTGCHQTIAQ
jgi:hypothetical protein